MQNYICVKNRQLNLLYKSDPETTFLKNHFQIKLILYIFIDTLKQECGNGETGRRTILRGWRRDGVWVQVPLPAPTHNTKLP